MAVTSGFVDAASAYEVILTLARRHPKDSFRMEWDRALDVTATLINASHINLAPPPRIEGAGSGAYGLLLEGLRTAISRPAVSPETQRAALSKTRQWANSNLERLRTLLSPFDSGEGSTPETQWLHSHIRYEWAEHRQRRGALFDHEFLSQIARVLDLDLADLTHLWRRSSDSALVISLIKDQPHTDEFKAIKDAFVVSTLLRGRYHGYEAACSGCQLLAHPIRHPILPRGIRSEKITIEISNTERYLANIVLANAFSAGEHERRVARWVADVTALRSARPQLDLSVASQTVRFC